jgi:hypothetical protein
MRKILTAMVAAATIGAATLTMSSPANAWWRGGGWGWGLGGFAAGAIIGSVLAAPYYYPYSGGYYGYSNYGYSNYAYAPYYGGGGYYGCQRVWNGWAWVSACY